VRRKPVIAIDGPSGVGKSTVAKKVAKRLGFFYVDTGALYRSVAWLASREKVSWDDGPQLAVLARAHGFSYSETGELQVDGAPVGLKIRTPEISRGASAVARHAEVRLALLDVQRDIGNEGGVVLEGRDIGTTVFPDAEEKFFLGASSRVRAERRFRELRSQGVNVSLDDVENEQRGRDENDKNREVSPLVKADDAVEISCDTLTADEVADLLISQLSTH